MGKTWGFLLSRSRYKGVKAKAARAGAGIARWWILQESLGFFGVGDERRRPALACVLQRQSALGSQKLVY